MNEYIKKLLVAKKCIAPIITDTPQTNQSGIYLFERTDEAGITHFYCGQAVNIYKRIVSHWNGFQRIDISMRKRKFKSEKNPYGWQFSILEYCPQDRLDEREQFYIMQNLKEGKQTYNLTYGSQGEGKTPISEYKPPKGYRDGLQQGYINARRDVKKLFEKNLCYSINGQTNKNKEKALQKFKVFLGDIEENDDNGF